MSLRTLVLVALGLTASTAGAGAPAAPRLTGAHPCPEAAGFTCSTLQVPIDRNGRLKGTLQLNVAAAANRDAPRGVLLFLTGGPGQPGVPSVPRIALRLAPAVLRAYQLVMIDQRGTGGTAIFCPELQEQVGTSDIAPPTPAAVRDCASRVGPRRGLYATSETVADLDVLRSALEVRSWTLDGVSYGTFTAERYALAHPRAVKALVLDSVVPHDPQVDEALYLTGLRATARVLRASCADIACGFDPANELNWLVRHGVDGVALFDAIVAYEFVDPGYQGPLEALHAAREGNRADLDALIAGMHQRSAAPAELFSAGLHAATLCSDLRFPWDTAATPAQRRRMLDASVRQLSERAVWPFDRATAAGNGFIKTCLTWPTTAVPASPPAGSRLPPVPTLLLNGDHDLSTPLEWAREEARLAPRGKLVVVDGASHSVQSRERGEAGRTAVEAFLLGRTT